MFLTTLCLNEITKFGSWDHMPRRWLRKSEWEKGRVGPVSAKGDAKGSQQDPLGRSDQITFKGSNEDLIIS